MKKHLKYILPAILFLTATVAEAQQKVYQGNVTISPYELNQRGDSLYIGMNVDMTGLKIDSRRSLDLIPVIRIPDGKEKELPSIRICGRNRYRAYKRELALMGKEHSLLEAENYTVVRDKRNIPVDYKYALPFEDWMKDARLDLKEDLCGCGGATQQVSVERLADNISLEKAVVAESYEVVPHVAYTRPEVEAVKQRALTGEAYLNFLVGKSNILPEFGKNPGELEKIRELIEGVKDDKDVNIRQISITGYASPEGSLAMNRKLSEARATALQNYLMGKYDLDKNLYKVTFGGEDWEGLVKLVEASDMKYKQEVLDIIKDIPITNGRETRLMALKGGEPYRYMLKEMFPALRRVIVTVDYDVKAFSLEEARKVISTRPQNLSLEEMYRVANSYSPHSEEFRDVFETAVRMFPDDDIANLNASAAALSRKDTATAEKYLGKVKGKVRIPEYENNIGILLLLKGDYTNAEHWLKQAESVGVKEAGENLKELERKQANDKLRCDAETH